MDECPFNRKMSQRAKRPQKRPKHLEQYVAIATIKAYCDKYTYILVNHTKQDQFFLSTLRLRYTWHLSTFIHTEKWKEIVILEK